MKKLLIQLVKFGIVGVIASVIDFGVLLILKECLQVDVLVASAIAFSVSVIANYILSMLFVFQGGKTGKAQEFLIFLLLSIGGLLLNQLVMWFGTDVLDVYYLWVKISACVVVPIYNFITRKIFLERKEDRSTKMIQKENAPDPYISNRM